MTALAPRPRLADASATALLDAAVDGDERAWGALCEEHLPGIRAVATARLRDSHAAEDVVQETLLRAWTRLHQVHDAERLGAWLKAIAANVAVDHVRRHRATAPLETLRDTAAALPTHDEVVVLREEAADLHERLASLRTPERQALWQRDGLGIPVGDVAAELGMTPGSVRVLLTRARKRVRDGYGVVAVPVVAGLERLRGRWAGLGDALPVALAAPVLVVAVVTTMAAPPAAPAPSAAAPAAAVEAAPRPAALVASTAPTPTPSPTTAAATAAPATVRATPSARPAAEPAPSPDAVRVGEAGVGLHEEPPTDHDEDVSTGSTPSSSPVEGIDVYLEETGLGDAGQECIVCP